MNILTEILPSAVELGGRNYRIRTDFRTWIYVSRILSATGSAALAAAVCYIDIPPDPSLAAEGVEFFFTRGEKSEKGEEALFSFDLDADYIYCAFLSQYGIDLNSTKLHWWKFISLFKGLTAEHTLSKIMEIRGADLSRVSDREARGRLMRLKRKYAIKKCGDLSAAF